MLVYEQTTVPHENCSKRFESRVFRISVIMVIPPRLGFATLTERRIITTVPLIQSTYMLLCGTETLTSLWVYC